VRRNFIDRFYEESTKDQFWNLNKKIAVGFVVLFLAVIMINTTGCTKNKQEEVSAVDMQIEDPAEKDSITIGNDGMRAGIASDNNKEDVEIVTNQKTGDRMVAMSIDYAGRSDPFLPDSENTAALTSRLPYDLVAPSEIVTEDPDAIRVVSTKVSGIMYDKYNPSAILNIEGTDHLVRSGDVLSNYKVLSIDKTNVTVQLGANIYKAGVGQLFSTEGITYNTISNLESKFGGSKNNNVRRK